MKLNPNELPETIKRLNPDLFVGRVETQKPKPTAAPALVRSRQKQQAGPACVVQLVASLRRELDSDNLQGALKPLRDAIAETLGIDDGDPRLRWEYGQVETRGEQGVMVKIELLRNRQ